MMLFISTLQAQINLPAGSPAASVTTTVGLTEVSISYFRPKMKGRKIFISSATEDIFYKTQCTDRVTN